MAHVIRYRMCFYLFFTFIVCTSLLSHLRCMSQKITTGFVETYLTYVSSHIVCIHSLHLLIIHFAFCSLLLFPYTFKQCHIILFAGLVIEQHLLLFDVLWCGIPHTHTHTRLTALFPGLPRWAGTRKVKPIWILLKQEIVSGSGISWAICKSARRSRQITTPAPHHSVFLQAGCPSYRPTDSVKALKAYTHTHFLLNCPDFLKSEPLGIIVIF